MRRNRGWRTSKEMIRWIGIRGLLWAAGEEVSYHDRTWAGIRGSAVICQRSRICEIGCKCHIKAEIRYGIHHVIVLHYELSQDMLRKGEGAWLLMSCRSAKHREKPEDSMVLYGTDRTGLRMAKSVNSCWSTTRESHR